SGKRVCSSYESSRGSTPTESQIFFIDDNGTDSSRGSTPNESQLIESNDDFNSNDKGAQSITSSSPSISSSLHSSKSVPSSESCTESEIAHFKMTFPIESAKIPSEEEIERKSVDVVDEEIISTFHQMCSLFDSPIDPSMFQFSPEATTINPEIFIKIDSCGGKSVDIEMKKETIEDEINWIIDEMNDNLELNMAAFVEYLSEVKEYKN
ncbi:hypothetical protein PFISCL1PPCAC_5431, partial [Pristionchus fissidentatus]